MSPFLWTCAMVRRVVLVNHANNYIKISREYAQYTSSLLSFLVNSHYSIGDSFTREDLKEVNPNKKVPAIDDNGFCLAER